MNYSYLSEQDENNKLFSLENNTTITNDVYDNEDEPIIENIENKSKIVNKATDNLETAAQLFSGRNKYKFGELIIVNDADLPSITILDENERLIAIHNTSVENGNDDIVITDENKNGSQVFSVSHAEIECENIINEEQDYEDKTVVSDITVSETGHITSIKKEVVPAQKILDVKYDGESLVSGDERIVDLSFVATKDALKEVSDNVDENAETLNNINEKLETGVKNEFPLTIDDIKYDGSEGVVFNTTKNTTGLRQYGKQDKLYLVGGESQQAEYGQTYTDSNAYILNGNVYSGGKKVATEEYVGTKISDIVANADAKLDTLKEIADYIMLDDTGAATVATSIANLNKDNVLGQGDVEKSVVLKDMDNVATSQGSIAIGKNTSAGVSGYYISAINTVEGRLYISDERQFNNVCYINPSATLINTLPSLYDPNFVSPYEAGDELRITIKNRVYVREVSDVLGNNILLDDILDIEFDGSTVNISNASDFTLYSTSKPNGGGYSVHLGSFAEGYKTQAYGQYSHAAGIGTKTTNLGEFAVGRYNDSIEDETIFSVGVGNNGDERMNIFEVREGDVIIMDTPFSELIEDIDNKTSIGHTHSPNDIVSEASGRVMVSNSSGRASWVDTNTTPIAKADLANKATKLQNAKTIGVSGAMKSIAQEFDGTNNISIPITDIKEGYITWGDKSFAGRVTALDMAATNVLNSNRLAFLKANGVTIEYSRDGGETWDDYGATDEQKVSLISDIETNIFTVGKRTTGNTVDDKLRITLNSDKLGIYVQPQKFLFYVTTNYASGCNVDIDYSTFGEPDVFIHEGNYPLNGWSGWNSIYMNSTIAFGNSGQPTHKNKIRFTFSITGTTTDSSGVVKGGFTVRQIRLLAENMWSSSSNMSKTGHIYSYDGNENTIFPKDVSAKTFNGKTIDENSEFTDYKTTKEGHYSPNNGVKVTSSASVVGTSNSETQFITGISADTKGHITDIEVKKLPTNLGGATTADIEIKGGFLADDYAAAAGITTLPAGTTLQTIMETLLRKEEYPKVTGTTAGSFSISLKQPSINASGVSNNSVVEVGTRINFSAIAASGVTTGQTSGGVGVFTYGYSPTLNKADIVSTARTISESYTNSYSSGSYQLIPSSSGFIAISPALANSTAQNYTNCRLNAVDMTVSVGDNNYTVVSKGPTYSYSRNEIPSYYVVSNFGNLSENEKSTKLDKVSSTKTPDDKTATFSVTGVYPTYTNISGGTLTSSPDTKNTLSTGNVFVIKNVPAENVADSHPFMFAFPPDRTLVSFKMKDPTGQFSDFAGYYTTNTTTTKTINGTNYTYTVLIGDGAQGEGMEYEITLSKAMNKK